MARRCGTAEPRIGDGPSQRLGGCVKRSRRASLAGAGNRRDLGGAAEIGLEVDLLGLSDSPEQGRGKNPKRQRWCKAHTFPPTARYRRPLYERTGLGGYARAGSLSRTARERAACATASIASRQIVSAGRPVSFMCNSACATRSSCARKRVSV